MRARPQAQLILATAAAVAITFGVQGISAALPALEGELGVSDAELGLFTAVYMLPAVLFGLPLGYLADRLGRRLVFVSMALLYGLAGGAQAWVGDFGAMLALRFLQGIAFGALMPLSITLIGDVYRGAAQMRAQAHRQVAMAVGDFALPLVGAALAAISWHAAFAAQGALLPLAVVGALLLSDARSGTTPRAYALELTEAVRQPGLPAVLVAGFLRFICKFALIAYLPFMLVTERGATLAQAALVLSVGAGVAAVMSLVVVRLLRWAPPSRLLAVAITLVGASLVGYAVAPGWEIALAASVVFGLGDGMLLVVQNALVTEAAPDKVRAGLVAVSGMSRNAGKLVSPLAMGALVLFIPLPLSFAVIGAATWLLIPALRPVRRLDGLLRGDPRREGIQAAEPV